MFNPETRYYVKLYRDQLMQLVLSVVASVCQTLFIIPTIYIIKHAFDVLIPEARFGQLAVFGLMLMILTLASHAVSLWSISITLQTTKKAVAQVRTQLVDKCFRLSRQFFANQDIGKIHVSLVHDSHRLDVMSNALISQLVPQAVIVLTLSFILIYLNWMLYLALATIFPMLYLLKRAMRNGQEDRINAYHRSFEEYSKGTGQLLNQMDLIRVQSAEQLEGQRQQTLIEDVRTKSYSMALFNSANRMVQGGLSTQVGILMLILGGISVGNGMMTLGALLSFYVAAGRMSGAMNAIFAAYPSLIEGQQSLITLHRFLNDGPESEQVGTEKIGIERDLSFENVSFNYGREAVLQNTELQIRKGRITALVGPNGAGKSTVVNLLLGFYRPNSGTVKVGDHDRKDIDDFHFRQQVGVVLQDQMFFSGTLLENICYGKPNATTDEVDVACQMSGVSDFSKKLPNGLLTKLDDNGISLSGGQKQKIALARALLRRPKLLILDEPTNHLDPRSVEQLMQVLRNLEFNPTVLIVTQDMNVAKLADDMLVLKESGQVHLQQAKAASL